MPSFGKRFRRAAVALAATAAVGTAVVTGLGPVPGSASSHREAPLVAADPQVDCTDLYAIVSPDKPNTTMIISNWIPFEESAGGPFFYSFAPGAHYDINIDNNGDAVADIIYRWTFTNHYRNPETFLYNTGQVTSLDDTDLNFYQTYDLEKITKGGTTWKAAPIPEPMATMVAPSAMPKVPVARSRSSRLPFICRTDQTSPASKRKYVGNE